jgi:hypothetical protein
MDQEEAVILHPNDADILCGSGSTVSLHPGNKRFRLIVANNYDEYAAAITKSEKMKATKKIMQEVLSLGSRFLKRDPIFQQWYLANTKAGRDKISHCLRELRTIAINRHSLKNAQDDEDALLPKMEREEELQQIALDCHGGEASTSPVGTATTETGIGTTASDHSSVRSVPSIPLPLVKAHSNVQDYHASTIASHHPLQFPLGASGGALVLPMFHPSPSTDAPGAPASMLATKQSSTVTTELLNFLQIQYASAGFPSHFSIMMPPQNEVMHALEHNYAGIFTDDFFRLEDDDAEDEEDVKAIAQQGY